MPQQTIPRCMTHLRTMTGKARRSDDACRGYMRIGILELERARHQQELRTTERAVRRITTRCREIDVEKQAILAACDGPRPVPAPVPAPSQPGPRRRAMAIRY